MLNVIFSFWVVLAILTIILIKGAVIFAPQNTVDIVEQFGKYNKTMETGLDMLIPFLTVLLMHVH
ncbi:MAG: hypothetical protein MRK00_14340 [Nitrosomonas sp.]|nr:hypothetical protein [Nitrosomonas sp.]